MKVDVVDEEQATRTVGIGGTTAVPYSSWMQWKRTSRFRKLLDGPRGGAEITKSGDEAP